MKYQTEIERHADPLDASAARMERELEIARSLRKDIGIKPSGHCYNCHEEIEPPSLFCDDDCKEDYEKRTRR